MYIIVMESGAPSLDVFSMMGSQYRRGGDFRCEKTYGGFRIALAFSKDWNEAECVIKRSNASYVVKIFRGKTVSIKLDGSEMNGDFIPFAEEGEHKVEVIIQ